jgi:hypothetical protein
MMDDIAIEVEEVAETPRPKPFAKSAEFGGQNFY